MAESPIHMECRYLQSVPLKTVEGYGPNILVIGEVVGIHIDESVLTEGLVDNSKLKPIGRLGYMDYVCVEEVFTMFRPQWPDDA